MAKKKKNKKKQPIVPKKKERMPKARTWLKAYLADETRSQVSSKIVKAYREKFRVDISCAIRELQELGHEFKDGYAERALRAEEIRIEQLQIKKAEKTEESIYSDFQDDRFAFIAGYTSGGAPYGITWEESEAMGIMSYEDELADELAELEDELFDIENDED